MKIIYTVLISLTLILGACGGGNSSNDPSSTRVRIHHGSPDAPAVDVLIDGSVALPAVDYRQSSGQLGFDPGPREIQVDGLLPADQTATVIGPVTLDLEEDTSYEIVAVNALNSIEPLVLSRPNVFDESLVRVTVLHGAHTAPAVDVYVTAPGISVEEADPLGTFAFTETLGPVEVPEGDYQIQVTVAGTDNIVFDSGELSLSSGSDLFISALVNPSDTDTEQSPIILSLAANDDEATTIYSIDSGSDVRVVHNSADAPAVDLVLNNDFENIAISNLEFTQITNYANINSGENNIKIVPTATNTAVIDADLDFSIGNAYTVIALNTVDNIEALVLLDDTRRVATESRVRIIHGSTLAGNVDIYVTEPGSDISGLSPNFSDVAFQADTGYVSLEAGTYEVTVTPTGSNTPAIGPQTLTFETAEIYTAIARDNADLNGLGLITLDNFNDSQ